MNNVVAGYGEIFGSSNNDLGEKQEFVATLEEGEEFFDALEKQESAVTLEEGEEFFDSIAASFDIPLSIFHYKDYNSDFFTSWYNVSSSTFKEINRACPEKRVLNLALSVLMLPYIAFAALGLVIYNRFKTKKTV